MNTTPPHASLEAIKNTVNTRIAPWYRTKTLSDQHTQKVADFTQRLASTSFEQGIGKERSQQLVQAFQGIFGTPKTTGYRNKNKFTFGYSIEAMDGLVYAVRDHLNSSQEMIRRIGYAKVDPYVRLGFLSERYPRTHILHPADAVTINERFKAIGATVEAVIRTQTHFKPFLAPPRKPKPKKERQHYKSIPHRGVWKYLTIRWSLHQDAYMVVLSAFTRHVQATDKERYEKILHQIATNLKALPYVSIFSVHEYAASFEPQFDDPLRTIFDRSSTSYTQSLGVPVLYEEVLGRRFAISAHSFFQVHTEATALLYQKMYDMFQALFHNHTEIPTEAPQRILLDMYCGTGSIGICLADLFDKVIGMDEVPAAIENATMNAALNHIPNAHYFVGKCEQALEKIQNLLEPLTEAALYVVVDPNRPGLHKKVIQFLAKLHFQGFIYCSCNVETWQRDIQKLLSANTNIVPVDTMLVDLFPHTKHYEVLSSFLRLGSREHRVVTE